MSAREGYGSPSLYDILMTPGTAGEMTRLEAVVAEHRPGRLRNRPWFEPACGTGRCLRWLAARGRMATGYDLDPAMTAYARLGLARRGLADAEVLDLSMTAPLPRRLAGRFGTAFNPWNSLRHLADDRAVLDHFAQVADALAPGGVYVVGLSLAPPEGELPEEDVWTAARGRCRLTQVINWTPAGPRCERAHVQTLVRRPRGEELLASTYDLRTYSSAQWRRLIGRSPLRRVAVHDVLGDLFVGEGLAYQLDVLKHR